MSRASQPISQLAHQIPRAFPAGDFDDLFYVCAKIKHIKARLDPAATARPGFLLDAAVSPGSAVVCLNYGAP
jgi:hypothetical protein